MVAFLLAIGAELHPFTRFAMRIHGFASSVIGGGVD